MTDAEVLDLAVTRTGHTRYRELLDAAHPDYNAGYWPTVRQIASGTLVRGSPVAGEPLAPTRDQALALAAVRECVHRGPVLPVSMQSQGCRGGERSECRAQRGPACRPGAVTLAECLACVSERSLVAPVTIA